MPERAVVNASPIILLSRVGELDLLRAVTRDVCVPTRVVIEVDAKGGGDSASQALEAASWLRRIDAGEVPATIAAWNLGAGESAVLAVASSMPGAHVILDDREARRCAAALGVPAFGTIGVVLRAKRVGAVPAVRPILERLMVAGMYVTHGLLDAAAAIVGE
jgi:predicted nucleic acid-binding protein